jgi:hypothetical protein
MESGFYKNNFGELIYGPNFVCGPGFNLEKELKNTYTYPVNGFYWFDSLEDACNFFELDITKYQDESNMPTPTYPPPKSWSSFEFLNKFTLPEMAGIVSSNDPIIKIFLLKLGAVTTVEQNHVDTLQAMNYLVSTGFITEDRKNEILEL